MTILVEVVPVNAANVTVVDDTKEITLNVELPTSINVTVEVGQGPSGPPGSGTGSSTISVMGIGASTTLLEIHNCTVLETSTSLSITIPSGTLSDTFACIIMPTSGTVTIQSDGISLINGTTNSITRVFSSNPMFAVQKRLGASNSFTVTGV